MQLPELVNMFGPYLQRRFGEKVHKLTLHGGFSCPNRDGTLGRGGCTFCNVSSFADEAAQQLSIADQLAAQAARVNRARRYLAYFQAYTSTYAETQQLRQMYQQALQQAEMVGLCVGTRPDCVPDAVLDLLAGRLAALPLEAYVQVAGELVRHTPPEVVFHRLSASARRPTLLAPLWCENRWTAQVEIHRYLQQHGGQGAALPGNRTFRPPAAKFA